MQADIPRGWTKKLSRGIDFFMLTRFSFLLCADSCFLSQTILGVLTYDMVEFHNLSHSIRPYIRNRPTLVAVIYFITVTHEEWIKRMDNWIWNGYLDKKLHSCTHTQTYSYIYIRHSYNYSIDGESSK